MIVHFANVLQPLIDLFEAILEFFHDVVGLGWGMSIIALTIVVRSALVPLAFKQYRSMQRLAHFQPQIKALQEKYKNDKERLQQEQMRFFRENKVNPLASCLPMVAQLPVFLALFYLLQSDLRREICPDINPPGGEDPRPCGPGGEAEFFFIPDLTDEASGVVLIALIVLYVGSQLLSTILMSTTTDRTQKMLFYALPFVFVPFIINFPAGLLVYWITTNFWTIGQQALIRQKLGSMKPPDPLTAATALAGDAPPERGPGGTTARGSEILEPVAAGARKGAPPPPPRRKKKRSGRRR